jgi:hypothetical protein
MMQFKPSLICPALVVVLLCGPFAGDWLAANDGLQVSRRDDMQKLWQLAQERDLFAACAEIESRGDAPMVATSYAQFANWVLSDRRDVAAMTAVSRAGIQYALSEARRCQEKDPDLAQQLKGAAKSMAYNLGANSWPGWNDQGIHLNASDLAAGLDAARLNLRLGQELKRGPGPMGNAYWLLGAQQLAARQYRQARESFDHSAMEFKSADKEDFELMARGYVSLARLLEGASEAAEELKAAVAALNGRPSEDAKFFAQQIETAREVFQRPASPGAAP